MKSKKIIIGTRGSKLALIYAERAKAELKNLLKDTGDIIVQKTIKFSSADTLKTSYEKLNEEIVILFKNNYNNILKGEIKSKKQEGEGSYHTSNQKNKYLPLLKNGYDTKVINLKGEA